MNHYDWLDEHFPAFLNGLGGNFDHNGGIISAHGDKCYSYKTIWEQAGIPFPHGVALYLLTYLNPWADEARQTKQGWVAPCDWVIANYPKFKDKLPPVSP